MVSFESSLHNELTLARSKDMALHKRSDGYQQQAQMLNTALHLHNMFLWRSITSQTLDSPPSSSTYGQSVKFSPLFLLFIITQVNSGHYQDSHKRLGIGS